MVKDRLDHMGLGLFCLEVHSAKASKAQVLKALKERMDAGRIRSNAEEIERARTALQEARRVNLALPGLALVHQLYVAVQAQGHGRRGTHALMLALERLSSATDQPN